MSRNTLRFSTIAIGWNVVRSALPVLFIGAALCVSVNFRCACAQYPSWVMLDSPDTALLPA